MEYLTLSQGLIHLILDFPPSPASLSPYATSLNKTFVRYHQMLKGLAERYALTYSFRQSPMWVFHFFTIIAYTCLGEDDLKRRMASRRLFNTIFNAIQDSTETVFLANLVLPPLEAAARKLMGVAWSPEENDGAYRRRVLPSEVQERTYSVYHRT